MFFSNIIKLSCIILINTSNNFNYQIKKPSKSINISIYYIPINKSTRMHIDSVNILSNHDTHIEVRKPYSFYKKLKQSIESNQIVDANSLSYRYIKALYIIKFNNNTQKTILLDAGGRIKFDGNAYKLNTKTIQLILSPLTKKQRKGF